MAKRKHSKLYAWQKRAQNPGPEDRCAKCGLTRFLTVDHVVPVSWLQAFIPMDRMTEATFEMEENFELLCRYCNQMKRNFIDPRNPKVYAVLEKVLATAKADHLPPVQNSLDTPSGGRTL